LIPKNRGENFSSGFLQSEFIHEIPFLNRGYERCFKIFISHYVTKIVP